MRLKQTCLALLAGLTTLLTGCNLRSVHTSAGGDFTRLSGAIHGGQQPVSGAAIQLYAVGTTGEGSPATALLKQNVTTSSDGTFNITNDFTCPASTALTYIVATGGNPGLAQGTNNKAIAMMAPLGVCGSLNASTYVSINEATTVASVMLLAPYMTSYSALGSASGDASSLLTALNSVNELVDIETGTAPGPALPQGYYGDQYETDTLADIIAPCINSVGGVAGDGSVCGQLFSLTAPASGPAPTDTIGAILQIAGNPTRNLTGLFKLINRSAPFQPYLTAAPASFTLTIIPTANVTLAIAGPSLVQTSLTAQYTASVSRTSNTTVNWSVNGVAGGNSSVGTIDSNGLYTAPYTLPSPNSVTVTATMVYAPYIVQSMTVALTSLAVTTLTYPQPAGAPISTIYQVTVTGNSGTSVAPVYISKPNGAGGNGADVNANAGYNASFTTFSSSGPVTVTVKKLTGTFTSAVVRPTRYGILPSHTPGSNTLTFTATPGQKMSVELDNDLKDRLLIFDDVLENAANVPSTTDAATYLVPTGTAPITLPSGKTTVYFAPGFYNIGPFVLPSTIQHVYLAGGAYVEGAIMESGINNLMINGRGVVDGQNFVHSACLTEPNYAPCDDSNPADDGQKIGDITLHGGNNIYFEGLMLTSSPQYIFYDTGIPDATFENFKAVGNWYYNNDGVSVQDNMIVRNCFMNAMDDSIKLFHNGANVSNCVVWQGVNGAVFQWGWGFTNANLNTISDIDVIHADWGSTPGSNDGVFVFEPDFTTTSTSGLVSQQTFTNINVETPVAAISQIGLHAGETFQNISITNLFTVGTIKTTSTTSSIADPATTNWAFHNYVTNGQLVTQSNYGTLAQLSIVSGAQVTFDNGSLNLVTNPGFETDAISPWTGYPASSPAASTVSNTHYNTGIHSAYVYNRTAAEAGLSQDVTANLLAAGQQVYAMGAALWISGATDTAKLSLIITDSAGTHTYTGTCTVGNAWTSCSSTQAVTWTGTLQQALFVVNTANVTSNLWVDDAFIQ